MPRKSKLSNHTYIPSEELKNISGVYVITSKINNKKYIGESVNLLDRLNTHLCTLYANTHYNTYLQNTFNKYGPDNIIVDVIELCSDFETKRREHHWVHILQTYDYKYGFNQNLTDPEGLGRPSEETKLKMSISQKKRPPVTEKTKKKLREANLGKKHTQEFKDNCRKRQIAKVPFMLGRKHSPETLEKLKISHTGKKHTPEQKLKMSNQIYQYDLEGNFIKEWESVSEASRVIGISRSSIIDSVLNRREGKKFKWKYSKINRK